MKKQLIHVVSPSWVSYTQVSRCLMFTPSGISLAKIITFGTMTKTVSWAKQQRCCSSLGSDGVRRREEAWAAWSWGVTKRQHPKLQMSNDKKTGCFSNLKKTQIRIEKKHVREIHLKKRTHNRKVHLSSVQNPGGLGQIAELYYLVLWGLW